MMTEIIDITQPHGELYIDTKGKAHFICHTHGEEFRQTEAALGKFIALMQHTLDNAIDCPYHQ